MKALAGILVAAGLASSAAAQCNWYLPYVPDFDQRRTALPNNGGMYCVPTGNTNLLAYIANHGVPNVMNGPRNWQSQANYNFVSSRIDLMGELMDTDPFDGTSGNPARAGLQLYLGATAPGKFTVTHYYGDYTVGALALHWAMGHLVSVCYGYYPRNSIGQYSRDGGHCVTLTGMIDFCDSDYRLRWRDPATDSDNLTTQSTFSHKTSDASSQTFIATDGLPRTRIRLWDLGTSGTTRRYLDSYMAINPLVCLSGGITTTNIVHIHRPVQIAGLTPPSSSATTPAGTTISDLAMSLDQNEAYIIAIAPVVRQFSLLRHDIDSGLNTEICSSNSALRMASSRHGHLFVFCDGSVRKYDLSGREPRIVQQVTPPAGIEALAYDDTRDELVALTSTRLIRYSQDLSQPAINEPLPTPVQPDGAVNLAIDEAQQRYYISGADAPNIFIVGLIPGAPRLRLESTLLLPAVQNADEIQFTDEGTLLLLDQGTIREFMSTAAAGWQPKPDSDLNGLPGGRALVVGRSRSNFVAGEHDTREWRNVTLDEGLPEVPDCFADFNNDGFVNSQDFFDFVSAFFAQDRTADFNDDQTINSQDFFDFLRAFFTGCP